MAWKIITTNILRGIKQVIRRTQNIIHTLSLKNFYNNIQPLVKAIKVNRKLLASCGERKSSISSNVLRVL